MINIRINGEDLFIPDGLSVQLELQNRFFDKEKLSGELIFTFDLPAQHNDIIFNHSRFVYVKRAKKYSCQILFGSVVSYNGDLYIQKTTKNNYSVGIVCNPFPSNFSDKIMTANQYADDIIISNGKSEHYEKYVNFFQSTYKEDSPIRFPLFIAPNFYGSSNPDFNFYNGISASFEQNTTTPGAAYINRLLFDGDNQVVNGKIKYFSSSNQWTDLKSNLYSLFNGYTEYECDRYTFAPAFYIWWILDKVITESGNHLIDHVFKISDLKKIMFQSLATLDATLAQYEDLKIYCSASTVINNNLYSPLAAGHGDVHIPDLAVRKNTDFDDGYTFKDGMFYCFSAGEYFFEFDVEFYSNYADAAGISVYNNLIRVLRISLTENGLFGQENTISRLSGDSKFEDDNIEDVPFVKLYAFKTRNPNSDQINNGQFDEIGDYDSSQSIYKLKVKFSYNFEASDVGKKFGLGVRFCQYQYQSSEWSLYYNYNWPCNVSGKWSTSDLNRTGNMYQKTFHFGKYMPEMSNSDFLSTICLFSGSTFYLDSSKKEIEIVAFKDINPDNVIDLTHYKLKDETEIETTDNSLKQLIFASEMGTSLDEDVVIPDCERLSLLPNAFLNYLSYRHINSLNAIMKSQRVGDSDENWVWKWEYISGNNKILEVGTQDGNTEEIKPDIKIPFVKNDIMPVSGNVNYIPFINGKCKSDVFDSNEQVGLILTKEIGFEVLNFKIIQPSQNFYVADVKPLRFFRTAPVSYDYNEYPITGINLTTKGNHSIGEIYVKPLLDLLTDYTIIIHKFIFDVDSFLSVFQLLKPQNKPVKSQIRWVCVDGVKLFPITMKFEITKGKSQILAEIKFAKPNIKI